MGLFCRRPLAMFSCIFLISALAAYYVSNEGKLAVMLATLLVAAVFVLFSHLWKKGRVALVAVAVGLLTVLLSFLQSFVFVGLPIAHAQKYIGENTALCYIIDTGHISENGSEYDVRITHVGDEKVSIRAKLVCGFDAGVSEGDEIYGLSFIDDRRGDEAEQVVTVYMNDTEKCYVKHSSKEKGIAELLFSENGIELLSGKLSDSIKQRLFALLGEEKGALAMGFFTGERSDITAEITRDFRRAGVSHLMAVSGSHIAILLGGIELILKKLTVHKNIRCALVTVCSLAFLFITGFSLSACRSVFMLYAVYIGYFVHEESDALTSLFVSVVAIVLLFPFSITDLGLWMSFLATLGLLTVYPVIEKMIPRPREGGRLVRTLLGLCRAVLMLALLTVIANMFLLPIIYAVFGEMSLVAVLGNILVNLPSSLFLLLVPILLLLSPVPIVGTAMTWIVSALAELLLRIVRVCSRIPNATVSLRYDFCAVIVALFTISLLVLLLVKLKRKLLVFLPYLSATAAFVVCFASYSLWFSEPKLTYAANGNSELILVSDNAELSVCDNTAGGAYAAYSVCDELDRTTATEIERYVLTHYHGGHKTAFELLSEREVIRNIYLPVPKNQEDGKIAEELVNIAYRKGINIIFFEDGETVELADSVSCQTYAEGGCNDGLYMAFWNGEQSVAYSSAERCRGLSCDTFIVGAHGVNADAQRDISAVTAERIYIPSRKIAKDIILPSTGETLVPADNDGGCRIIIELNNK